MYICMYTICIYIQRHLYVMFHIYAIHSAKVHCKFCDASLLHACREIHKVYKDKIDFKLFLLEINDSL